MKRFSAILLVAILVVLFSACSDVSGKKELINANPFPDINQNINDELPEVDSKEEVTNQGQVENNDMGEQEGENNLPEQNENDDSTDNEQEQTPDKPQEGVITEELIASGSTIFNPAQINRSSNIRLASSYIDGTVLKPQEEFSFNRIVGERTTQKGFLPADIFYGSSVVKGVGGGICQASTTICIAVKNSDMKIVEQNPHSLRVSYAAYEDEAMISYGTSDFRFVNTYDFPVEINITFEKTDSGEIMKCDIFKINY